MARLEHVPGGGPKPGGGGPIGLKPGGAFPSNPVGGGPIRGPPGPIGGGGPGGGPCIISGKKHNHYLRIESYFSAFH